MCQRMSEQKASCLHLCVFNQGFDLAEGRILFKTIALRNFYRKYYLCIKLIGTSSLFTTFFVHNNDLFSDIFICVHDVF